MPNPVLPFKIEPMKPADIPTVISIEQQAYSMTWPARAYDYELTQNRLAHYYVIRAVLPDGQKTGGPKTKDTVIGLGGFWLLADEAHVSTVALHPDWRGLGLGEWMLLHLIKAGQALEAEVVTLEVRPSNRVARSLYEKYHFSEVGRRLRYYTDNNEDALILTTPVLRLPEYQAMLGQRKAALERRLAQIDINNRI